MPLTAKSPRKSTPDRLKFIAQSKLHLTWRSRILIFAECRRSVQGQAGLDEIHVIKGIVGFGPELNPVALPREPEGFCDAEVEILHAGEADQRPTARYARIGIREAVRGANVGEHARIAVAVIAV